MCKACKALPVQMNDEWFISMCSLSHLVQMHVVSYCIMLSSCRKPRQNARKRQRCEFQKRVPSSAIVPLSPSRGTMEAMYRPRTVLPDETLAIHNRKLMTNTCFAKILWIARMVFCILLHQPGTYLLKSRLCEKCHAGPAR